MNIYFSSTHLQTLCNLKALAEKHGCSINFGVNDFDDFTGYEKFTDYSEAVIEELRDRGYFWTDTEKGSATGSWFELFDPNNEKCHYHNLTYFSGWQAVEYEPDDDIDDDNPLSKEAEEFLGDNTYEECDYGGKNLLYVSFADTEIRGFEGQEHPSVYREGMALKFFGDLVCDYLGEERITRVY